MNEFFVLGGGRRHGNDGALVWNIEDRFAIHLPACVRQTRHELVQLCHEVILYASNPSNRETTVLDEELNY